ncbi:MAG TPA: hypothetical protein VKT32_07870 [Chthonomonadaceae bacterium]|nr:hypothetical protein [Chthonomonadaceae bacterium]
MIPPLLPLAFSDWTGLLFVFLIFGGGGLISEIIKNMNRTRVEIATLRSQQQGTEGLGREMSALRETVEDLRRQVTELRDTTTQYDLSIDTNMQHMERRLETLERQARSQGSEPVQQRTQS